MRSSSARKGFCEKIDKGEAFKRQRERERLHLLTPYTKTSIIVVYLDRSPNSASRNA